MVREKYKNEIKETIQKHLGEDVDVFIYGSAVEKQKYHDIDVGVQGKKNLSDKIYLVKEDLERSTIPYKIDVVDFNSVDDKFKNQVFKNEIIWLT